MKKTLQIILTIVLSLQLFGGPVWAAEAYPAATQPSTVTTLAVSPSERDQLVAATQPSTVTTNSGPGFPDVMGAISGVKSAVDSVVNFFVNFDPGKIINNWIQTSLGDLLKPLISWSEKNSAQYPYIETTDPQFTWWTFLAFFGLVTFMFAGLKQTKQIMNGERPIGDIALFFGLLASMFGSIWVTNMMVHFRNQLAYAFISWMSDMKWLVMDPVQSSTEFIIPDLAKSIIWVNQGYVSSILAFILGGLVMLCYELLQMLIYGTWIVIVVGSPFFLASTAWSDDYTPLTSYLSGLARTLIASILIIFGWGIQAYVYTNQTETVLQIILQALTVLGAFFLIYMFWGKFMITEVFGMLSHPVQTVRGNVTSKIGSGLKTSGKLKTLAGLATGRSEMAASGQRMEMAGDRAEARGEEIKIQAAGRGQVRYQDTFSRLFQQSPDQRATSTQTTENPGDRSSKFSSPKPVNKQATVVTPQPFRDFANTLDRAKERLIPQQVHELFENTSTPGGGHYFKYTGPEEAEIEKQFEAHKIPIQRMNGHIAVESVHEAMAKRIVAQSLQGRKRYWTGINEKDSDKKKATMVTVDKLGITRHRSDPPRKGINMGPWQVPKEKKSAPEDQDVPKGGPTKPPSVPNHTDKTDKKEGK